MIDEQCCRAEVYKYMNDCVHCVGMYSNKLLRLPIIIALVKVIQKLGYTELFHPNMASKGTRRKKREKCLGKKLIVNFFVLALSAPFGHKNSFRDFHKQDGNR